MFRVIVIVGSSNLKAANIKKGVKIFNVTGTWTGWVDSTVTLYNRSNKFNSVHNMKYFGSKSGSVSIYPAFESVDGVWTVRLPMRKSGSTYYGRLWFWFYDQIGKTPYIDTIEPWFWWLDVRSTYDTIQTWKSLVVVEYPSTRRYSVSELQNLYDESVGGSLSSGAPGFTGDKPAVGQRNRLKVQWYVPEEIPKSPGYSVKLTWSDVENGDSDYIWTGQVKIFSSWVLNVTSSKLYLDRINYHPVK